MSALGSLSTSNATASHTAAQRPAHHAPQPRPAGIFLALFCSLFLLGCIALIALASQFARLFEATRSIDAIEEQFAVSDAPTTDPSNADTSHRASLNQSQTEDIEQISRALDSFDAVDFFLRRTLAIFSLSPAPMHSIEFERELLQRIRVVDGLLHTHQSGRVPNVPSDVLQGNLQPDFVNALPAAVTSALASVATSAQQLLSAKEAYSQALALQPALVDDRASFAQQAELVTVQAIAFFGFSAGRVATADPSSPNTEEHSSLQLYQSGLLEGVPLINGVPDAIETSEALIAAISAAGGEPIARTGKSQQQIQADLENLRRAAQDLKRSQQTLANREAQVQSAISSSTAQIGSALVELRRGLLRALAAGLHARTAQIERFLGPIS